VAAVTQVRDCEPQAPAPASPPAPLQAPPAAVIDTVQRASPAMPASLVEYEALIEMSRSVVSNVERDHADLLRQRDGVRQQLRRREELLRDRLGDIEERIRELRGRMQLAQEEHTQECVELVTQEQELDRRIQRVLEAKAGVYDLLKKVQG
jgi:hypothetical protein